MISFASDYTNGAHSMLLEALIKTNNECLQGYGEDSICDRAKAKIKATVGIDNADVEFLTGGTQTNAVVISTMLNDYEGVIAAESGHISVHEAGAIEYTGHKVLTLPQHNGKLDATELDAYLKAYYEDESHEHMVFPGMVYISFPTEYGTLYSENELTELSSVCRKYSLPLYIDGARLGYGLMSRDNDISISKLAELCDVFYIGGTKVGALCGEAVVFTKNNRPKHFNTSVKKRGAMLAKGRLIGAQFDALFTDDLYFKISKHAIDMADKLKLLFKNKEYKFFIDSPTNQQFVIISNEKISELKGKVGFSYWEKYDNNNAVVRFASSWSTKSEDIDYLSELL